MIDKISHLNNDSDLEYQDQSAHKLKLTVVVDDIDLSQFRIVKEGWLENDTLIVQAGIIGTSHFVKLNHDKGVIYEVLSCSGVECSGKKLFNSSLSSMIEASPQEIRNETIHYAFQHRIESWNEGRHLMDKIENECLDLETNRISLVHDFASIDENDPPKTLLVAQLERDELQLKTVHGYPNEGFIVFTNSRITIQ
ncbi:MAG: DUF2617 family protein [Proteobacteria bacterium]|nr:DUF2617 family protein [Pseudomonadota bacterium]